MLDRLLLKVSWQVNNIMLNIDFYLHLEMKFLKEWLQVSKC